MRRERRKKKEQTILNHMEWIVKQWIHPEVKFGPENNNFRCFEFILCVCLFRVADERKDLTTSVIAM